MFRGACQTLHARPRTGSCMSDFVETHRHLVFAVMCLVGTGVVAALVLGVGSALGTFGHHADAASGTVATTTSPQRVPQPHASSPPADLAPIVGTPSSAAPQRVVAENASGTGAVLPVTGDPSAYATGYASALFSYDTRNQSEAAWAAVLTAGLDPTSDVHADNVADLADRTPPAAVWATMTGSSQRATYLATSASVPTLWADNAAAYPVGAFAVTVTGTQQVTWNGGASTAPQAVTLLLLCPPFNDSCVVNRIAAQVLR
jgi:hypothetical protein